MKMNFRKMISLLCALCMLLTSMPFSAFAEAAAATPTDLTAEADREVTIGQGAWTWTVSGRLEGQDREYLIRIRTEGETGLYFLLSGEEALKATIENEENGQERTFARSEENPSGADGFVYRMEDYRMQPGTALIRIASEKETPFELNILTAAAWKEKTEAEAESATETELSKTQEAAATENENGTTTTDGDKTENSAELTPADETGIEGDNEEVKAEALEQVDSEETDETNQEIPEEAISEELTAEEPTSEEEIPTYSSGTFVETGAGYQVTVTYGEDACFPAGTEMRVREIPRGTREYKELQRQAMRDVMDDDTEIVEARFFDITFYIGEEEIEPRALIDVQITYTQKMTVEADDEVRLVHIDDDRQVTEMAVEPESIGPARNDADSVDSFSFSSDSFSVYGILRTNQALTAGQAESLYTLTFSGNGASYVVNSQLAKLSVVLTQLGIDEIYADEVEIIEFREESDLQDNTALEIQKTMTGGYDDYLLTAIRPFEQGILHLVSDYGDEADIGIKAVKEEAQEEGGEEEPPEEQEVTPGQIRFIDQNGTEDVATGYVDVSSLKDVSGITFSESSSKWYVVTKNKTFKSRITIEGDINLILGDGATLKARNGIALCGGNKLTVWCQKGKTGKLIAESITNDCAGIGGNSRYTGGDFVLHSGTVEAKGYLNAAGIGGGLYRAGGAVTIYGGTLTAQGGEWGAGIGGGLSASQGGKVTISGGTVTAIGGDKAAGIGGGQNFGSMNGGDLKGGDGEMVVITGGTVIAKGGSGAAAIGGGQDGNGGTVNISGDCSVTVTAGIPTKENRSVQAIGYGEKDLKTLSPGQLFLSTGCSVRAGSSAGAAEAIPAANKVDGCRMAYAEIKSETTLDYSIVADLERLWSEKQTGTISVQNANAQEISTVRSGGKLFVYVSLKMDMGIRMDSPEDVTLTYQLDGEEITIPASSFSQVPNARVNAYWFTFDEIPVADPGSLLYIHGTPKTTTYQIIIKNGIKNGSIAVQTEDHKEVTSAYAGKMLLINGETDTESDYWMKSMTLTGETSKTAYITLPANTDEIRCEGGVSAYRDGTNLNVIHFEMPAENVILDAEFTPGIRYVDQNGNWTMIRRWKPVDEITNYEMNDPTGYSNNWFVVRKNTTFNKQLKITNSVNLILCDGATLTCNGGIGIQGENGGALTIWAQRNHSGVLIADATVKGNEDDPGIGAANSHKAGNIIIYGGNITAKGCENTPGIGGGDDSPNALVEIHVPSGKKNDFTVVTATGGKDGAGIGGGDGEHINKDIRIYGGKVTATGGKNAAGIGGGNDGKIEEDATILISGGEVTATGGTDGSDGGAGIGSGFDDHMAGTIKITGGTVTATGAAESAGIGAGDGGEVQSTGKITIQNATVTATGGKEAPGIGAGDDHTMEGSITITNATVTATGKDGGAGIGGSDTGKFKGSITIKNSTVNASAEGSKSGAAIGGGYDAEHSGSITIEGGKITATSKDGGAGIGSGYDTVMSGTITIKGKADVTATAQRTGTENGGAGIGAGYYRGSTGAITLEDSTVKAYGAKGAAGIGSGEDGTCKSTITIKGGTVQAYGGTNAPGIGSGDARSFEGKILIQDLAVVESTGAGKASSMGSGGDKENKLGTVELYPTARVLTGKPPTVVSTKYTDATRNLCVHLSFFSRIEPCTHPNATVTINDDGLTHHFVCNECAQKGDEKHVYADSKAHLCSICSYDRSREIFLDPRPINGMESVKAYSTEGEEITRALPGETVRVECVPAFDFVCSTPEKKDVFTTQGKKQVGNRTEWDGETLSYTFIMQEDGVTCAPRFERKKHTLTVEFDSRYGRAYTSERIPGTRELAYSTTAVATSQMTVDVLWEVNDGYYASQATLIYTDGTPAQTQPISKSGRSLTVAMPTCDATIRIDFDLTPWAAVYHVVQNADGSWPELKPENAVIERVENEYRVPLTPDPSVVPEGMSAGLFKPSYYAYSYTDHPNRGIPATSVDLYVNRYFNEIFIFYGRREYPIYFYNDVHGKDGYSIQYARFGDSLEAFRNQRVDREGYTFAGWSVSPLAAGKEYSYQAAVPGSDEYAVADLTAMIMPSQGLSLYPVLIKHRLRVHLDVGAADANANETNLNGWTPPARVETAPASPAYLNAEQYRSFTTDSGERIRMDGGMNQATRDGYTLDGWFTQNGQEWAPEMGTDPEYCDKDEQGNPILRKTENGEYSYYTITLKANWDLRDAIVSYSLTDGELTGTGTVPAEQTVSAFAQVEIIDEEPTAPDGYAFVGWEDQAGNIHQKDSSFQYMDLSCVTTVGSHTDPSEPNRILLTAKYESLNPREAIRFDTQGGSRIESVYSARNTISQATIEKQGTPVRTGYTFQYWKESPGAAAAVTYPVTVATGETKTLYAEWKANEHTLTFQANGGAFEGGQTEIRRSMAFGDDLDAVTPADPKRDHYTFQGWVIGDGETSAALPEKMPDRDLVAKATWTINEYTLTFDANGGTDVPSITLTYGAKIVAPGTPRREDCAFLGWTWEGRIVSLPETMTESRTYTAAWKRTTPEKPVFLSCTSSTIRAAVTPGFVYTLALIDGENVVNIDAFTADTEEKILDGLTAGATYQLTARKPAITSGYTAIASDYSDPAVITLPQRVTVKFVPGAEDEEMTGCPEATEVDMGQPLDDDSLNRMATISRAGYLLRGWYTMTNHRWTGETRATETLLDEGTADRTITLYAGWTMRDARASFDLNGGTLNGAAELNAVIVQPEASIDLPEEKPVKEGYLFLGWRVKTANGYNLYPAGGSIAYRDLSKVTTKGAAGTAELNAIQLTAQYTKAPTTYGMLIPDSQGGSHIDPIETTTGFVAAEDIGIPVRDGYDFDGWTLDGEGNEPIEETVTVPLQTAITIYAQWTARTYRFTFEAEDGAFPDGQDQIIRYIPYGAEISAFLPEAPEREHHFFDTWIILEGETRSSLPETMPAREMKATAVWMLREYTLTFDTNGGTSIQPITLPYGATIIPPANPQREGGVFQGWAQGSVLVSLPSRMESDQHYTARWKRTTPEKPEILDVTPTTMTIRVVSGQQYRLQKEENGTTVTEQVFFADGTETAHLFDNLTPGAAYQATTWKPAILTAGETAAASDLSEAARITLPESVTVKLVPGEDAILPEGLEDTFTVYTGETLGARFEAMNRTTRPGYGLGGWYTSDGIPWDADTAVNAALYDPLTRTLTLTAHWRMYPADILFDLRGGTPAMDPIEGIEGGDTATLPTTEPALTGYTFVGWVDALDYLYQPGDPFHYMDAGCVQEFGDEKHPVNRITLTARYTRTDGKLNTLKFDTQGGSYLKPIRTPESSVSESAVRTPVWLGHAFLGWTLDAQGTQEVLWPIQLTADETTIYAQWEALTYTITFDPNGGTPIDPITGPVGDPILAVQTTREYYKFITWNPELPDKMPAADLTVEAVWEPKTYTLVFDPNGGAWESGDDAGKATVEKTVSYGYRIARPEDPTREGYQFFGWTPELPAYMNPDLFPEEERETLEKTDGLTVYAWWKQATEPPKDFIESVTHDTITVRMEENVEYCILHKDNWQENVDYSQRNDLDWRNSATFTGVFTGLEPKSAYRIGARRIETDDALASGIRFEAATTTKAPQEPPARPQGGANFTSVEVYVIDGLEYRFDEGEWIRPANGTIYLKYDLEEGESCLVYARRPETETHFASEPSEALELTTRRMIDSLPWIEGDPLVGEILTLQYSPANASVDRFRWQRNGENIPGETNQTYLVQPEDLGTTIRGICTQIIDAGVAEWRSEEVTIVEKVPAGKAERPILDDWDTTWIRIEPRNGEEYSIDGGETWQEDGLFTDLTPDTAYSIVGRFIETETREAGEASDPLEVRTNRYSLLGVTIVGEPVVGSPLRAIVDPEGLNVRYQWYHVQGEEVVVGATGSTYTPVQADVGCRMAVMVAYDRPGQVLQYASAIMADPVRGKQQGDQPAGKPGNKPTDKPTDQPTDKPEGEPTDKPTDQPTDQPEGEPTDQPTDETTPTPTPPPEDDPDKPTDQPPVTQAPPEKTTDQPTDAPTATPTPTPTNPAEEPEEEPTTKPTETPAPTPSRKETALIQLNSGLRVIPTEDRVFVQWGAVDGAVRYRIYTDYCGGNGFERIKTVAASATTTSFTKIDGRKLKPTKNVKAYVVAVGANGKILATSIEGHAAGVQSRSFSNPKKISVGASTITMKKGTSRQINGKITLENPKKRGLGHMRTLRYASSNSHIARVNIRGKITAVGKGTCDIYVYAENGVSRKITVKVR